MNGTQLSTVVKDVVATLMGSWTMLKPSLLQTFHRLALSTSRKTRGIQVPEDAPIHDLTLGSVMRPSEMQQHLLARVIPPVLVAVQALAEDALNDRFGDQRKISHRIEQLVTAGQLTRNLASRAHYWRIVRNVVAHADGRIDDRTVSEARALLAEGKIDFDRFRFWGPLLDARKGGEVPVPLIEEAVARPHDPDDRGMEIPMSNGQQVSIGLADLLAAADTWAQVLDAAAA